METDKSKHILMVAYHYPPILHSSGVHRTAKFAEYLPKYGWKPCILTVHPRAYIKTAPVTENINKNISVTRAFGLDTSKHLSIKGRYFRFMALPDKWVSWSLGAIPHGLLLIRKYRPRFIWSTFPISTAHLIGFILHKLSGIQWIVDFRDPMTDANYPENRTTRKIYKWIEKMAITHCCCAVFTTSDTLKIYTQRFPDTSHDKFHVIPNGFDEETFLAIENSINKHHACKRNGKLHFVHSGILYPSERNPEPFFLAISELKCSGVLSADILKITLRASGTEEQYQKRLKQLNINDIVHLEPPIVYNEALKEMMCADGLLLFQAANCNHQIPAKVYEYLRAKRPIFALTDPLGNTARLLNDAGINTIVNIENKEEIKLGIHSFIENIDTGTVSIASDKIINTYSREHRTKEFANILNSL